MPKPRWTYLIALLHFTKVSACSTIAEIFPKASHDCLTRMLNGDWSGQTLLDWALRILFLVVGGYLIVDDTVVEKPHAKRLNEAGWVWSSKRNKAVYGVSVVLLVWTDGQLRIPIGFRVWKKGGPSKFELALELLSYARNRLKCKPQLVLFDAWYPSKALLKRIGDYGWYFVCRLKKNRGFEGRSLHKYLRQPYWQAVGFVGKDQGTGGEIPPHVLRDQPTEPDRPGGAPALSDTPGSRRSDPSVEESAQPRGLSSRLHAVYRGND
jgi:hypothetical protein